MATGRRRGLSPAHGARRDGARRDGARRDGARRAPRRGGRLIGAARGCLFVLACWGVDFATAKGSSPIPPPTPSPTPPTASFCTSDGALFSDELATGDQFGDAVAIDGDLMVELPDVQVQV